MKANWLGVALASVFTPVMQIVPSPCTTRSNRLANSATVYASSLMGHVPHNQAPPARRAVAPMMPAPVPHSRQSELVTEGELDTLLVMPILRLGAERHRQADDQRSDGRL